MASVLPGTPGYRPGAGNPVAKPKISRPINPPGPGNLPTGPSGMSGPTGPGAPPKLPPIPKPLPRVTIPPGSPNQPTRVVNSHPGGEFGPKGPYGVADSRPKGGPRFGPEGPLDVVTSHPNGYLPKPAPGWQNPPIAGPINPPGPPNLPPVGPINPPGPGNLPPTTLIDTLMQRAMRSSQVERGYNPSYQSQPSDDGGIQALIAQILGRNSNIRF